MMNPNIWVVFHKYNQLVRRDIVPPLTCDLCGSQVVTRWRDLDDPNLYLWCYTCNGFFTPGPALMVRVRAIVEEFFVEPN